MSAYPETPHLAWPVRLDGDHLAAVEQDTGEDVAQCVQVVVSTPKGSCDWLPDFGVDDQTFNQGGADPGEFEAAIREWEPRADIEIDDTLDERTLAQGRDRLGIRVRVAGEG